QLSGDGARHRARTLARSGAGFTLRVAAASRLGGHAAVSKLALAGSPVLFHAAAAGSAQSLRMGKSAARLAQGLLCRLASAHCAPVGSGSGRRNLDTNSRMGVGREPRLQAPADDVDDHPAAMRQADDPELDELVSDLDDGDAADLDTRRQ